MEGGIYTRDKCPVCGKLCNYPTKDGLSCPDHQYIHAKHYITRLRKTFLNFSNYKEAEDCLTVLRYQIASGQYDERDYKKDNPLGFANLMKDYWTDKTVESTNRQGGTEQKIKDGTKKNYANYKKFFCNYFGNENIKLIAKNEGKIEDCFNALTKVGNKTKDNYRSFLDDFFAWVWRRNKTSFAREAIPPPELPKIKYTLKYKKIVSKEGQIEIVEEVKRLTLHINPKIYYGIKWCCTYPKVRPAELLSLLEGNINLSTGHFIFPNPKEDKWKAIKLLQEDIEIIKSLPRGMPAMPFFRHVKGISGVKENEPFGAKYLYKWWIKAAKNLGYAGVDLYRGSKTSTMTAWRKSGRTPEEIRSGSGHISDAMYRYLIMGDDQAADLYAEAVPSSARRLHGETVLSENGKILKFKD